MKRKIWQLASWRKRAIEFKKGKSCEWCGKTKDLSIHHPQKKDSLSNEKYESFEGTMILCRSCHFAWHKGLILCSKCKKRYHKRKYDYCYSCFSKTEQGKLRRKSWLRYLKERKPEELPMKHISLCGRVIYVPRWQEESECFGALEACMHYCPDRKVRGDIYKCKFWIGEIIASKTGKDYESWE